MSIYKFVNWDIRPLEDMENTFPYRLHKKLENGEALTREEKDQAFSSLIGNSQRKRGIPLHGWMFDYSDWLTRYWVKTYDNIYEYWAFDKTSIRTEWPHVQEIVEIED